MASVSAIVLNYCKPDLTVDCVKGLLRQRYCMLDVVVVDNHSVDDSWTRLQAAFGADRRVSLLRTEKNLGYAGGNNRGAEWCLGRRHPGIADYLLICNNDVCVREPSTVALLTQVAEKRQDAGIVAPKVVLPNGFAQGPYGAPSLARLTMQQFLPLLWWLARTRMQRNLSAMSVPTRVYRVIGAFLLVRPSAFVAAGLFDEGTFMYAEEDILAERLRRAGWGTYYVPSVQVLHRHESGSTSINELRRRFIERSSSMSYYFSRYRHAGELPVQLYRLSTRWYAYACLPVARLLRIV